MANLNSKLFIPLIVTTLILTGCKDVLENHNISSSLDKVLADYTSRYDKDSVLTLNFYKIEDRTLFDIGHSPFYYNNEMDGCFTYKNKLVVYYSNVKDTLASSLIDSIFASDKTILKRYTSFDEANCIYDGKPDVENYIVKSRDCIVKAEENDLKFKEIASDTTGIRNKSLNSVINKRLNNCRVFGTAIRFAEFEKENYFILSYVDSYTSKNLDGCLERNGRIITFYGVKNLHYPNIIDQKLIRSNFSLLDDYKEFSSDEFDSRSRVENIVYRISPKGLVESVSLEEWGEEKTSELFKAFGL